MQDLPQEVLNSLAAAGSCQLSSKQLAVKLNADHQKVVGAVKSLGTKPLNHVLPRPTAPLFLILETFYFKEHNCCFILCLFKIVE